MKKNDAMIFTDEELKLIAEWERGVSLPQDRAKVLAVQLLVCRETIRELQQCLDVANEACQAVVDEDEAEVTPSGVLAALASKCRVALVKIGKGQF